MRRSGLILKLLLLVACVYLAVVALAFLAQDRLIFPAYLVGPAGPTPAGAERLVLRTSDGMQLEGILIPAAGSVPSPTLALVFVGNASNAQGVAELLHEYYPDRDVVAFFYRGYAPSSGAASARQLVEDAPLIYDLVAERYRPRRIIAIGISIGTGVAAALATERPLAGLILVTPFDSLSEVARQLYPWLPVSMLLRHDIDSVALLRHSRVPVAIIAAGRDRLVRIERTERLRRAVPNLVLDVTVAGAGHNDIAAFPEFAIAMREALIRIEATR